MSCVRGEVVVWREDEPLKRVVVEFISSIDFSTCLYMRCCFFVVAVAVVVVVAVVPPLLIPPLSMRLLM